MGTKPEKKRKYIYTYNYWTWLLTFWENVSVVYYRS